MFHKKKLNIKRDDTDDGVAEPAYTITNRKQVYSLVDCIMNHDFQY
jgi:hypothetical protein